MWTNFDKTSSYLLLSFTTGNGNISTKHLELACSSTTSLHGHFQLYVTRHLRELMTFVEHRRLFFPGARSTQRVSGPLARPLASALNTTGERESFTAAVGFGRPIGRFFCGSGERQHPPFQTRLSLVL